jgi:hypothetical protein
VFSLAAELRVLAVGLFAVAAGALLLDRSVPVGSADVAVAAGVVGLMFVLNVAVGLAGVRRARSEAGTAAAATTATATATADAAEL